MADNSYWSKRLKQEMMAKQASEADVDQAMSALYRVHQTNIEKEIQAFYQKYADGEGVSITEAKKRADKVDVQAFADKAKRYVEEKDFSPQANAELKLYNLKMRVSRAELLQYNMDLELLALGEGERQLTEKFLRAGFADEVKSQSGILGEYIKNPKTVERSMEAVLNVPFEGVTWSERIWERQQALRQVVARTAHETLVRGRNAMAMIPELRREFGVSKSAAKRLAVTEVARVQSEAQKISMIENGFDEYEYIAEPTACPICAKLDGNIYKVAEMEPGKNCAPMHPHCHCSTAPHVKRDKESLSESSDALKEKIDNLDIASASVSDIIEIGEAINAKHDVAGAIGDHEKLKEIFSNYREMGGVISKETWAKGSSKLIKDQLSDAFAQYPKDWANIPSKNGRQLYILKRERGYFAEGAVNTNRYANIPNFRTGYLTIASEGTSRATVYHEIGHMVEWGNKDAERISREFIKKRTEGERLVSLLEIFPGSGFNYTEVTKPDDFISPYIGKEYRSGTEVLSMGLQGIYTPESAFVKKRNPDGSLDKKLITDDPEFLNLIIGLIVKG